MMLATLFDFPWEERRKLTYWSDVAICNVELARRAGPFGGGALRRAICAWLTSSSGSGKSGRRLPPKLDLISMMAHGEARGT